MNLYLDSSALVKRYLREPGTAATRRVIDDAEVHGTVVISRAEVSAALAKAVRTQALTRREARVALEAFRSDWPHFAQMQVTEAVMARADRLAWAEGLRGYDAVQLGSALVWSEYIGEQVIFATFDRRLWEAAAGHPLVPFPDDLPALLRT